METSSVGERRKCICPLPNCTVKLVSVAALFKHLKKSHSFSSTDDKFTQLLMSYTTAFFLFDSKLNDHSKFANVCMLCAKATGSVVEPSSSPTYEEAESHITNHVCLNRYICVPCKIWFTSETAALTHSKRAHDNTRVTSVSTFLSDCNDGSVKWEKLAEILNGLLTQSKLKNEQCERASKLQLGKDDLELMRSVDILTPECHSLKNFSGKLASVLKIAGHWEKTGKCIQASTSSEIQAAFEELSVAFNDLLFHPNTVMSMTALIFRSDDYWWSCFIDVIDRPSCRREMYNSCQAAHLVRKLLCLKSLSTARFSQLSSAFVFDGEFEADLVNSEFSGVFFAGFASRCGVAAAALCKYASRDVVTPALSTDFTESIRILIKSASCVTEGHETEPYEEFLEALSEAVPKLLSSINGLYVVQTIFYHPTQSVKKYIQQTMTVDWIFEKTVYLNDTETPRFDSCHYSHLIQTAIHSSSQDECCDLAWELHKKRFGLKQLLNSKAGNNIIRILVQKIGDPQMLDLLAHRLKQIINKDNSPNKPSFKSICVSLAINRSKLASKMASGV